MSNEACCAHRRVEYRTENYRLTEADVAALPPRKYDPDSPHVPPHAGQLATRGWWECASGCGTRFSPVRADSPSLSETAAIAYAVMRRSSVVEMTESKDEADARASMYAKTWPANSYRVEPLYLRSSLSKDSSQLRSELERVRGEVDELRADHAGAKLLCDLTPADTLPNNSLTERVRFALARARSDSPLMNWLETMTVNVRTPTRYGSGDLFWASPTSEDADTEYAPSPIRAKIREHMRASGPSLTEASDSGTTKTAPSETPNG